MRDRTIAEKLVLKEAVTFQELLMSNTIEQEALVNLYFRGKQGLDCYLKYLEGFKYREGPNFEETRMARRIAEEMIAMCPENPMSYFLLANVHEVEYWVGSEKSPQ